SARPQESRERDRDADAARASQGCRPPRGASRLPAPDRPHLPRDDAAHPEPPRDREDRGEEDAVACQPVCLAELADEGVEEYGAAAEQSQQVVRSTVGRDLPPAMADRWLMRRVLVNLVVNAMRHGGGHEVLMDATVGPTPREITVRVVDSGRGIRPEDQ